jgi:uncharacterized membrane protein (UPF0127 family)
MATIKVRVACAAAMLALAASPLAQDAAQKLPTIRLNAGIHVIQAEVAQTPEQRATGLMHRKSMGASEGMLFAFEQAAAQCFWMKNTLLPLSIAFVEDDGTVVNIENMQPQTLDGHCSKKPVRFALEMNQGWFTKRGIGPGTKLQGAPFGK